LVALSYSSVWKWWRFFWGELEIDCGFDYRFKYRFNYRFNHSIKSM